LRPGFLPGGPRRSASCCLPLNCLSAIPARLTLDRLPLPGGAGGTEVVKMSELTVIWTGKSGMCRVARRAWLAIAGLKQTERLSVANAEHPTGRNSITRPPSVSNICFFACAICSVSA
jgi:hypothetical protein